MVDSISAKLIIKKEKVLEKYWKCCDILQERTEITEHGGGGHGAKRAHPSTQVSVVLPEVCQDRRLYIVELWIIAEVRRSNSIAQGVTIQNTPLTYPGHGPNRKSI